MRVWVDLTNSPHVLVMRPATSCASWIDSWCRTGSWTPRAWSRSLLSEGRMRRLTDSAEVSLERRSAQVGVRIRRDPNELVKLLLSAAD